MRVDLDGLIRAREPDYLLWNKTPRCRVVAPDSASRFRGLGTGGVLGARRAGPA